MTIQEIQAKWVKRARMWCVTRFVQPTMKGSKIAQHQDWFVTEEEANKFIEEKKNEMGN